MKRHPSHNYSTPGGYFITFTTFNRKPLLGQIEGASIILSDSGKIVEQLWHQLPKYFPNLTTDAFQIMPDHIHCILIINDPQVMGLDPVICSTVSSIVKRFKGSSAREINKFLGQSGNSVWQKGYHERVIRGERDLEKFRYYTETNPLRLANRKRE